MAEPTDVDEIGIAGTGTAIVATDRGFVRFLSGSGLQKYVWNLGEEVVSAAAGRDWAMVVWAAGGGGLEYALLDTDTFEVVQQGRMPLGKGATLKWIGFTEEQVRRFFGVLGADADDEGRFRSCMIRTACCRSWIARGGPGRRAGFLRSIRMGWRGGRGNRSRTGLSG